MVCRRCGAEIPDWFVICGICGTPVKPLFRRKNEPEEEAEGMQKMRPSARMAAENGSAARAGQIAEEIALRRAKTFYSRLSLKLAVIAVLFLGFPIVSVIISVMAILFGAIGLYKGEDAVRRAVAGIAAGGAAFLLGVTLAVCLTALSPYMQDLEALFESSLPMLR